MFGVCFGGDDDDVDDDGKEKEIKERERKKMGKSVRKRFRLHPDGRRHHVRFGSVQHCYR